MTLDSITQVLPYIELILGTFANPVLLLCVLMVHTMLDSMGFYLTSSKGYNSLQVRCLPYLMFCAIVAALWQVLNYWVLTLGTGINFVDFVFSQHTTVFGWLVYLVSIGCHYMFFKKEGIEGNVIGFIFFPIIIVCATYQAIHHFIWVYQQI